MYFSKCVYGRISIIPNAEVRTAITVTIVSDLVPNHRLLVGNYKNVSTAAVIDHLMKDRLNHVMLLYNDDE